MWSCKKWQHWRTASCVVWAMLHARVWSLPLTLQLVGCWRDQTLGYAAKSEKVREYLICLKNWELQSFDMAHTCKIWMLARDELGATANFAGDWRVDFCYCTIVEQRLHGQLVQNCWTQDGIPASEAAPGYGCYRLEFFQADPSVNEAACRGSSITDNQAAYFKAAL